MNYYEAPDDYQKNNRFSVFLAGGITGCPDWQSQVVSKLSGLDMDILNPRRKNFDVKDPNASKVQIEWEFHALKAAKTISFWFCAEPIQPITLFELGRWSSFSKSLIVGVDPKYCRKQDVYIQMELAKPGFQIQTSLDDLAAAIKESYLSYQLL